jgi:putative flippase GtrA
MITPSRAARFARYAVVGVSTLAIYLALGEILHRLNAQLFWQASVPFLAAVTFNYLLQRGWVFDDSRPAVASLPKYVVMIVIGYLINFAAFVTLSPQMPLVAAQLIAAVLVVISNAVFSFSWVFIGARAHAP